MDKKILTVNPGSTAVKYVLFSESGAVLEKRIFDRKEGSGTQSTEREWLGGLENIGKIGIRIVHGGDIVGPVSLNTDVKMRIKEYAKFAPIHNTLALEVVQLLQEVLPKVEIVASFDTDFHKTMPEAAYTYPIDAALTKELGIKRYGFHGLAVQSVVQQLGKNLVAGLPSRVICAHLGGGCSLTAVKDGKSVDTSMGLTPLAGVMMLARSGSIGPGVIEHVAHAKGWPIDRVLEMLNTKSGFYGLTGSKNTRDIIERASKHQEPEKLAVDIFVHQVVKQIFAYTGVLQGCDALVFSGGMGYGNAYLRSVIVEKLQILGITEANTYAIEVDEERVLFENCKK